MPSSIVRTLVPWAVAYLLPLAGKYLGLTEDQLSTLLTLLLGAAYYVLVRLLERWVPQASILLGSLRQPVYTRPAPRKAAAGAHAADPGAGSDIAY